MKNGIRPLVKCFKNGNVSVTGKKGSGKDVLFGNVIARRKSRYISNVDYTKDERYIPLNFSEFDCGGNTFQNFLDNNLNPYSYPYEDKVDIYVSDAGNYMPSQYNSILDKKFMYLPTFFSLQRQLADANTHNNSQAYGRVWNKLREQGDDVFIRCDKCKVIFGIVFASYYFYDKAESCENRIKPCRVRHRILGGREARAQVDMYKDNFYNTHGTVQKRFYICINKSKHDTRAFKRYLAKGGSISDEKVS